MYWNFAFIYILFIVEKVEQFPFPFTFWLLDMEIAKSVNWKWHSITNVRKQANEQIRFNFYHDAITHVIKMKGGYIWLWFILTKFHRFESESRPWSFWTFVGLFIVLLKQLSSDTISLMDRSIFYKYIGDISHTFIHSQMDSTKKKKTRNPIFKMRVQKWFILWNKLNCRR